MAERRRSTRRRSKRASLPAAQRPPSGNNTPRDPRPLAPSSRTPRSSRDSRSRSSRPPKLVRDAMAALRGMADTLLHPCEPTTPPWKYLPLVLALAFAARVAIALSGDFLLHPDEIMQYLEQAHRLAFGNGVVYWEYFYGARSWLMPGLIAGVLMVFKTLGLGEPFWYIGGVEVFFCAFSLLIPVGMYFFARRHFSEPAARIALLAGAFWYELVGFAHRSMTEFVATSLLLGLLALSVRPQAQRNRILIPLAGLAVLTAAVRVQYAPLALLLLGVVFLRSDRKLALFGVSAAFLLTVGVFDAITWGGGLFHSYLVNIRFNFSYAFGALPFAMPAYQFLLWLFLAGAGLSGLCLAMALGNMRRYGLLLALTATILLIHSAMTHKEYRFVFVILPLWLLIGSDLLAQLFERATRPRLLAGGAAALFTVVVTLGIMNVLPWQNQAYRTPFTSKNDYTRFIPRLHSVGQIFSAYRYLAEAPGVSGVWQQGLHYSSTPGYYYLHHQIPFYDNTIDSKIGSQVTALQGAVSHIVSGSPSFTVPGYSLLKSFGPVRILRRDSDTPPVRQWQEYVPQPINPSVAQVLQQFGISDLQPPANDGIHFAPAAQPGAE